MNEEQLKVEGVCKSFGGVIANDDISLSVPKGGIIGLIGPNGSGKTTLFNSIVGYHPIDKGSVRFEGREITGIRVPEIARLGLLRTFQQTRIYGNMTCVQNMQISVPHSNERIRIMFSKYPPEVMDKAESLLEFVGLYAKRNLMAGDLSFGQQKLLEFAMALMNEPDLVVLDEPTDGVDPVGRRDIRDVLLELRKQGRTVFLNSHLLSELEMVCDRVAILVQGRVVQQGTIDDLTADSRRYEIEIEGPAPAWATSDDTLRVRAGKDDRTTLISRGTEAATVQPIIDRLRQGGHTIVAVKPVRETLEDLFMRAVTDPATGKVLAPGAAANESPGGGAAS